MRTAHLGPRGAPPVFFALLLTCGCRHGGNPTAATCPVPAPTEANPPKFCVQPSIAPDDRKTVEAAGKLTEALVLDDRFARLLDEAQAILATSEDAALWKSDLGGDDAVVVRVRRVVAGTVPVGAVHTWNPWAYFRTIAWDGGAGPILFNAARLPGRKEAQISGTLLHEVAHRAGYYHRGNASAGNECTVPYVVGDLAEWVIRAGLRGRTTATPVGPQDVSCDRLVEKRLTWPAP